MLVHNQDHPHEQGQAKPMLIVMPLGYGEPKILLPNSGAFRDRSITDRNFDKFREALLTEVIPRIESAYLVKKERDSRAIAGLSMGGAESLLTGLNTLDKFSWVGAFSSGGFTPEFDKEFPALDSKSSQQLHLLWIACGTDDSLIDINRKLRAWLTTKSVKHADIETPGAHTWMVWRRNLAAFTPLLFGAGDVGSGGAEPARYQVRENIEYSHDPVSLKLIAKLRSENGLGHLGSAANRKRQGLSGCPNEL